MRSLLRRLLATLRPSGADRDLDDEVGFHLQMLTDEYRANGMSEEEARAAARRSFGGVEQVKQIYRERRGLPVFQTLWQDIRHGGRGLRRSPAFTAAAVVTLTLGIGATAAIFSVARAVVFKPLPYRDVDRRVMIWSQWRG
ncbi:MAG: hypothetical protein EHM24_08200, partial [Acidobacteria bacterium]